MNNDGCDNRPGLLRLRCCDVVVMGMGLAVAFAALFRPEITFFFMGE